MESQKDKTIITITGIRPDFIRMSEIFRRLDEEFNHILIHTGQHYDKLLSDVFFEELQIRQPNFNLNIGSDGKEHFHQVGEVSVKTIELLRKQNINPNLILFLGDSNSVTVAMSLRKEGYTIGHIEAGMRSGDKRMLEEINRTVCDHCSHYHFVYHDDYKMNLIKENLSESNIHVVGNTIVEVCNKLKQNIVCTQKTKDFILMDIHRPENFKHKNRLQNICDLANKCSKYFNIPIKCLKFGRTVKSIKDFDIHTRNIEFIDLMSYKKFLSMQYNSLFMISDSGTAQEEPALLNTPVIVPRDYTERPQSVKSNCSLMVDVNFNSDISQTISWINSNPKMDVRWMGDGTTSQKIINILNHVE